MSRKCTWLLMKVSRISRKSRLILHEMSVSSGSGRAHGFELNVEQLRNLPAVERFGRIRKGLRCFLNRRRVAGWELECLMDHVTFLGLLRRETLSLFHCVYRFARKFYHRREPLWISRAELEAFIGVMTLIEADWANRGFQAFSPAMPHSFSGY